MTHATITRVIREGVVDTANYRYRLSNTNDGAPVIKRLPIDALDTTKALDGWTIVHYVTDADFARALIV